MVGERGHEIIERERACLLIVMHQHFLHHSQGEHGGLCRISGCVESHPLFIPAINELVVALTVHVTDTGLLTRCN